MTKAAPANRSRPDGPRPRLARLRRRARSAVRDRWGTPEQRLPLMSAVVLAASNLLVGQVMAWLNWTGSGAMLLLIASITGIVVCATVFWIYGTRMSARLARINDALDRVRRGDHGSRLEVGTRDEIGRLCEGVNRLMASTETRERDLKESALVDPLTGLPNRTLLTERIRQTLALSKRSRSPFAVAVLDLDRFKFINDTLGHATGDVVLREVAQRLRSTVRESDTVARLGGDEFVLLLQGSEDIAREVTARIIEAMKAPLHYRDQIIDIGVSIGVAVYPQHGEEDLTLLRHADGAMYRAKRRRAGVAFFDGESAEVRRSYLSLLGELRRALEGEQFSLDYQPKLDLHTGRIVGLEGLVRWNHPSRGQISPAEFIHFAEQTGFMREITRWVVRQGARFASRLAATGLDLRVAVNVAAQDIENPGFTAEVAGILREHAIPPGRLTLEVTESGVVSETEAALANLRALAALGVRLSVDDFGTGYSTLKQLKELPVHELKIDRSFVSGMNENRGGYTIVKSTIDLGKQLGLTVVAEGVETIAELRALSSLGCDEVQGYYLAKPMPEADVPAWVEMRHALYESSREDYYRLLVGR